MAALSVSIFYNFDWFKTQQRMSVKCLHAVSKRTYPALQHLCVSETIPNQQTLKESSKQAPVLLFSWRGNPRMGDNFYKGHIYSGSSLSRRGSPRVHGAGTDKRGTGCSLLPPSGFFSTTAVSLSQLIFNRDSVLVTGWYRLVFIRLNSEGFLQG